MSRSYKKNPITGITCSESEKKDKEIANRKLRRKTKIIMADIAYNFDKILPKKKETSDIWNFSKDGKINWADSDYEKKARRK